MATDLTIFDLPFKCVKLSDATFSDVAIYVILCVEKDGNCTVIDVGQPGQTGSRINAPEREEAWKKNCETNNIWVCNYRTPQVSHTKTQREALEAEIRDYYQPVCGKKG